MTPKQTRDFRCAECLDTGTIDRDGAEIPCPYCEPTVRLTGLRSGLGSEGERYFTSPRCTSTTIEFYGTPGEILADVRHVRAEAEAEARRKGLRGRNYVSSGPIAIERRVRSALRGER